MTDLLSVSRYNRLLGSVILLSIACGCGDRGGASGPTPPAETSSQLEPTGSADSVRAGRSTGAEGGAAALKPDAAPDGGANWRITIAAAGDVIPHNRVKATAAAQVANPDQPGAERHAGWWYVFGQLARSLELADLGVANLESPVATERKRPDSNPPVLNAPSTLPVGLEGVGFAAVSLANNHMHDQLRDGIAETAAAVAESGLGVFGAGVDRKAAEQALYLERSGVKVALLGWTFALNRELPNENEGQPWIARWDKHRAFKAVSAARAQADLVVVSAHWGAELKPEVFWHQRHAAELLCGAGADLVIGSGPHILQSVEWVEHEKTGRKCLVAYSLGNLVSNQGLKYRYRWKPPDLEQAQNVPATRDGLLLRVTFTGGTGDPEVAAIDGVPLWTENNFIERFVTDEDAVDRIRVQPILPGLAGAEIEDRRRKLLEERLFAIKKLVGELVRYVPN